MTSKLGFFANRLRRSLRHWSDAFDLHQRFPSAHIDPSVRVISPRLLTLGERVRLQQDILLHCGGLTWSQGRGHIAIGDDSILSPGCILYGAGEITIGSGFDCGPGVMIFSSRSGYEGSRGEAHVFAPVRIGNDVIVYAGCIIGPGVTIGDGAVVGAGSVVLTDVPAASLAVGSPARVARTL